MSDNDIQEEGKFMLGKSWIMSSPYSLILSSYIYLCILHRELNIIQRDLHLILILRGITSMFGMFSPCFP